MENSPLFPSINGQPHKASICDAKYSVKVRWCIFMSTPKKIYFMDQHKKYGGNSLPHRSEKAMPLGRKKVQLRLKWLIDESIHRSDPRSIENRFQKSDLSSRPKSLPFSPWNCPFSTPMADLCRLLEKMPSLLILTIDVPIHWNWGSGWSPCLPPKVRQARQKKACSISTSINFSVGFESVLLWVLKPKKLARAGINFFWQKQNSWGFWEKYFFEMMERPR